MPIIWLLIIAVIVVWLIEGIKSIATPLAIALAIGVGIYISYQVYIFIYFKSDGFKKTKESIKEHIKNCNELNNHIEELKSRHSNMRSYDYGEGRLYDESNYNFRRKEWGKRVRNIHVHNCSASVCRNASDQPFKYLCKYFDIKIDEAALSNVESALNDFSAVEQGKVLLQNERNLILSSISNSIPQLILYFSKKKLMDKLGFDQIDLSDLYFPVYRFQYVSAGGNSSMKVDIQLNIENLNKFVNYLNGLIKFRKSISGQRTLMTSGLREIIKNRDGYACQICGLSVNDEKNLLLEIDHIVPLSKGGITSESNLQTLCWKCNRSKGAKIYSPLTQQQLQST